MNCPGCGAPDDQGCRKGCPEVAHEPYYIRFDHINGKWYYHDMYGSVWCLQPTGDPNMPLYIIIERIGDGLNGNNAKTENDSK